MEYEVGMELIWQRNNNWSDPEEVVVQSLRRGGRAMLSNGWVVDEDGIAEGTALRQGGYVTLNHKATPK